MYNRTKMNEIELKQLARYLTLYMFGREKVSENIHHAIKNNMFLCGGALRSFYSKERPNDIDIYFNNELSAQQIIQRTKDDGMFMDVNKITILGETDTAFSFHCGHTMIQLIKVRPQNFCTIENILESFDFTITKIGCDGEYMVIHDSFFRHLVSKDLVFEGSQYPVSSLKRVMKYIKRGYSICDENLIKIVEAIVAQRQSENGGNAIMEVSPHGHWIYPVD